MEGESRFQFIESYPTHSIFILDEESKPHLDEYKRTLTKNFEDDDKFQSKKKGELKKQRKILQKYIIELPLKKTVNLSDIQKDEQIGDNFYLIDARNLQDLEESDKIYSKEFGFNLNYKIDTGLFTD